MDAISVAVGGAAAGGGDKENHANAREHNANGRRAAAHRLPDLESEPSSKLYGLDRPGLNHPHGYPHKLPVMRPGSPTEAGGGGPVAGPGRAAGRAALVKDRAQLVNGGYRKV